MIQKFLKTCTMLGMVFFTNLVFINFGTVQAAEKYDVVRTLGDENAPVVLHELSSMTCPFCQSFHATAMKKLKSDYIETGKVRLVMHQFPLDNVATVTAMLGLTLPEENYFAFIEHAFANQQQLRQAPLETLEGWAKMSGLDLNKVSSNQDLLTTIIRQKNADQKQYKVEGTPTLWINDIKYQFDSRKPEAFFKVLDKEIAKKSK